MIATTEKNAKASVLIAIAHLFHDFHSLVLINDFVIK